MKSTELLQFIAVGILSAGILSPAAFATLGMHVGSVETDRQALQGKKTVTTNELFDVHVLQNPGNTTREYVSKDGVVFGVTWRGIAEPDLSQILGNYYEKYKKGEAQAVRASRRAPLKVKNDGIVVEKAGHMRDVHGRAYVPELLPSGVTAEDIK